MGFECYRIGDLLLDAGTQEVTRSGVVVPVPRLSFKLLLVLTRQAPNVVTTQQLEKEVWSGLVVDRGTVNKRVLLLRKSLGEDAGKGPYITVVRGSGYRMLAPVECVPAAIGEPLAKADPGQSWYQRSASTIRTTSYWLLGLVALLALYQGVREASFSDARPVNAGRIVSGQAQLTATYSRHSIAVLPFVDLSDGQQHQYLGDGIAEEVINLLSGMDGLEVAARTSSFAFRDKSLTAMDIADDLRVGTILEGSIRHEGTHIRVTAQLIDTQNGYHIWSQNYDRDFEQVFAVQDDIAVNIAEALKLTLDETMKPDSRKATTGDIEAFAQYLKGRQLMNNRIQLRAEGLRDALQYYRKAIEIDPKFARAHASIAATYWLLTSYDASLDQKNYLEQAEASAQFALEIDPASTDALSVLASIHAVRGEIEQAAALFLSIQEIGSNDPNMVHWHALLHLRLGYFDELIAELKAAARRDPLNEHLAWSLAAALNFSGKPGEAAVILADLKHFAYRDYSLGLAAINAGDYVSARELFRDVRLRSGVLPAAYADVLINAIEHPARKDEAARKFIAAANDGKLDKLVSFEALLTLGSPRVFDLDIDPVKDIAKTQILTQVWNNWSVALRQDPRFKQWVEKLGYVDFWRKHGWPDRCRPTGGDDFECI